MGTIVLNAGMLIIDVFRFLTMFYQCLAADRHIWDEAFAQEVKRGGSKILRASQSASSAITRSRKL